MIEIIPIENREQWLDMRSQDVTASVAGALLGVHEWTTAFRLFNLKAKISADDDEETEAMIRGRMLEDDAVEILRRDKPNWQIEYPVGRYYRDSEARIGATPDVLVTDEHGRKGIVQIKTVIMSDWFAKWASDRDAPEPPLWIAVQTIIEAKLTGAEFAYAAALLNDRALTLQLVEVPIHMELYDRITGDVAEFWQRIAENRPYAPDYKRDGAAIAERYHIDDGTEIDLSGDNQLTEMFDQLIDARASKKAAEALETEAKAYITHKMGFAATARLADGRRISNKEQTREVKCKHMLGQFCSQSQFRVIKPKKG